MDGLAWEPRGGLPEPLGPLVSTVLKGAGLLGRSAQRRLAAAWCEALAEAVGADASGHTRIVGLRRGVLEVEVDSPVRLQEMANFHRAAILRCLAARLGSHAVRDVRFRPAAQAWAAPGG